MSRPCSVANFGATGEGVSIDFAASTMVAAPPKNSFCDQSVAVTTVTSVAAAAAAAAHSATPQDSEEPTSTAGTTSSGNQWWQWTMRKLMSQPSSSSEPAKHATPRMAIADRGGCLFEDKANTAAKYGVGGVVVRNSEVIYIYYYFCNIFCDFCDRCHINMHVLCIPRMPYLLWRASGMWRRRNPLCPPALPQQLQVTS